MKSSIARMPHSKSFNMSAESSLEYFNITTCLHPIYFFVSLDASAWTFLRSVCGSVRVAAMCSRTLSANAPFIGSLLDFTPSIAQIYSVANKTKIAETSKYTPANVLSETRLCRSQGCRIAHVRARMQHTPPCDGAYVALECTGGRFCYLGSGESYLPYLSSITLQSTIPHRASRCAARRFW